MVSKPAGCLSPERASALVRGLLPADELAAIRVHLEGCPGCHSMVLGLLHASPPTDEVLTIARSLGRVYEVARPLLARGATVGRFIIIGALGAGGMGVVYAAFDPELDRKIAIKLVKQASDGGDGAERAKKRLLREAQAMARLNHPNVIPVYDVGTSGDDVFIAMEYVDGATLRGWREERARTNDEIVALYLEAGRALAAAHRAGIVHRDFKPDNVLVGKDGRARVVDFGLARGEEAPPPPGQGVEIGFAQTTTVTRTGVPVGTPAYMAPEQRSARAVDARSDQFSFCAALYEALIGERATLDGGAAQLARLPPRLRRPLARGLAIDPAARFATMEELLTELAPPPPSRRRWPLVAVPLLGVLAGSFFYRQYAEPKECVGASERLAGVWDAAAKDRLRAAFVATGAPFAAAALKSVTRAFDAQAKAWVDMRTDACRATYVRRAQSVDLLDRRVACLEERRAEWKAQIALMSRADRQVVENSVRAASSLADLSLCANAEALRAPVLPPRDAATRKRVDELREQIAEDKALGAAGRLERAHALAAHIADDATALGYAPVLAEALMQKGDLEMQLRDVKAATRSLLDAAAAAERGHDEARLARSLVLLMKSIGFATGEHHTDEGLRWGTLAAAAVARVDDLALTALYADGMGVLYEHLGRMKEAEREIARAIEIGTKIGHPDLWQQTNHLGMVLVRQGKLAEGEAIHRRALAQAEATFGPAHPNVAQMLNTLAWAYYSEHELELAKTTVERAVAIMEAALGSDSSRLCSSLKILGQVLLELGKVDDALAVTKRALAIEERRLGPEDAALQWTLTILGQVYVQKGNVPAALPLFERALAVGHVNHLSPTELAETKVRLARALWTAARDRPRARLLAAEARNAYLEAGASRDVARVDAWLPSGAP